MQKHSRGSPFQCSKPTNLQQLHDTIPAPSPFLQGKKDPYPLELCINLHTSPLQWFLLLMLRAIRPLLPVLSIPNYQPPINSHSTIINSAQTYSTHRPSYSDVSIY